MTLFDLLTVYSFFIPIAFGAKFGWKNGAFVGLLIGAIAGLVIGLIGVRVIRIARAWATRVDLGKEQSSVWLALAYILLLALVAWIMFSSFLAAGFTEFVVQSFAAKA